MKSSGARHQLEPPETIMRLTFWLLPIALLPLACKKGSDDTSQPATHVGAPSASVVASASSAAPAASSAAPAAATLPARRSVPDGKVQAGTWMPSFELEGQPTPAPQSFEQAREACHAAKLSLCSETQWERACEADATLGQLETWTVSMDGPKVVTRGGDSCSKRALVAPAETSPSRGLVCCTRAVGINTDNPNDSFLRASAERVRALEAAMTENDATKLDAQFDADVLLGGKETPKDQAVSYYKGRPSSVWSVFDVCEVKIDKEAETRLLSECRTTTSAPSASRTLIVYGGPASKVQLIGPPDTLKLLPKKGEEKKERVRSFIQ